MLAPYQLTSGGSVSSYSDVQKAVRVEKFRIWFAWICGNVIMLMIAGGTRNVHVINTITQILFTVVFFLLTFTAIRMSNALNRKALAARREVLGEDL
jgi:purine-cytosine permease-like protein